MRRPGTPVLPILPLTVHRSGVFRKKKYRKLSQSGRLRVYPGVLGGSEARYANGSLGERGAGVEGGGEAGALRGW
jgi:hypothetical protein